MLALRQRDFRLLWAGNVLSMTGSQMRLVGVTWQLYQLTHDPVSLGVLGLTRFIPLMILVLPAGLVADRHDRRRVLLVTQSVMMLCSAGLCALTLSGRATPAAIYALLSVSSAAATFDLPARQSLIPSLVPRDILPNALSLNITGWNVAAVVGPMLGGLILAHGVAIVYFIDTLSFVAMLLAVLCLHYRHVPEAPDPASRAVHAALEGLHFVFTQRLILSTMILDFLAMFFGAANTMLPIFADQIMHVDERGLGMLYAAPSLGAVVAGFILASYNPLRRQGPLILVSVAIYGLCTALFGISQILAVSLVLLAATGAADTVSAVVRNTIRQLNTPDGLRGRMTAVNSLFFVGGPQLGEVEAGYAAAFLGAGPSVFAGGLACAVCVGVVALCVPELRRYDQ